MVNSKFLKIAVVNIESVLNIECSVVANATSKTMQTINLLRYLTVPDPAEVEKQEKLRASPKEERDVLKKEMLSLMTGIFSARGKKFLVRHSGLIAIDIDQKDNKHIRNYSAVKQQLSKLSCVAYCGLSVSGTGYWALIAIQYTDKHEQHFEFIRQFLASKGLVIDPACKNVDRLRFYSFDPEAYFNHNAKRLQAFSQVQEKKVNKLPERAYKNSDKPVWVAYNATSDFIVVLLIHGWKIAYRQGTKTSFTRPGKKAGVSAEYDEGVGSLFIFSSNAAPFEPSKAYTPFQVYAILEHCGNFKAASRALSTTKAVALKSSRPVRQPAIKPRPIIIKAVPPPFWNISVEPASQIKKDIYTPADVQIKKEDWSTAIADLQAYFKTVSIPKGLIGLQPGMVITDPMAFVESHIEVVLANNGNKTFKPFLQRLAQLKAVLEKAESNETVVIYKTAPAFAETHQDNS